jgi:quercetin dioxygenase-like cupin family protein
MDEGTIRSAGEGERQEMGASSLLFKATEAETGGALYLSEMTVEPGFTGPPLHTHARLTDMFYVLEGTLTFQIGEDRKEASAGAFVCAPPGVPHTFSNLAAEPARFLNFNVPGGFEHYIRRLAEAWQEAGGPPDPAVLTEIVADYDIEVVGPPVT